MQSIKSVIILNKKEGETPLESLEGFRITHKAYTDLPMTYAGRLDPMATGLLVVLTGEECKQKEKYLALDKEYEFSVLFGFATDTYDILGKIINTQTATQNIKELEKEIKKYSKEYIGTYIQKYPLYSSKTVDGMPLFAYAKSGIPVESPEREVHIKSLRYVSGKMVGARKLYTDIKKRIKKVHGDFRQEEILSIWKDNLENNKHLYFLAHFKVRCSSGTYVRSIAHTLGEKLGIPTLAYSIKRTRVGKWSRSTVK